MELVYKDIEECEKTLTTVERIWHELLEAGATREDILVAIGGGATLDTVGFAAATYKRGMRWVAVPTTLLAMVDAGIGGKTAVNYAGYKNIIGAFYPPSEVRIDTSYLRTLPYEQLLSGVGEMIKHGLLDTPDHLTEVLAMLGSLDKLDNLDKLSPLIQRSRSVKERVVAADPTEQGLRKCLNLGHTVGHALEALSQEGTDVIPHGYAVVYGLVAELYLSHVLLGLDKEVVSAISHLIPEYYPRPNVSCRQYDRLLDYMRQDKKGPFNFTLLRAIGEPVIHQTVCREQILEALDYLFSL